MYTSITRKFREAYNGRKRNSRPAKQRKIQSDIEEEIIESAVSPPVSERSDQDAVLPSVEGTGHGENEAPLLADEPPAASDQIERPLSNASADSHTHTFVNPSAEAFPPLAGEQDLITEAEPIEMIPDGQTEPEYRHLVFEGEDETDYTKGPARMVFAEDGFEQVAALLMTLDLSQKIQAAVRAERHYASAARLAQRSDDANYDFEERLRDRIADHESRAYALKDEEGNAEELEIVQSELAKLHLLMENTQARRQCIAAELSNDLQNWREAQAEVNAYLADAFVSAALLEPEEELENEGPVKELSVEEEYEQLCRELQQSRDDDAEKIIPLHDFRQEETRQPSLSPEQQADVEIKDEFWSAWHDLESAQAAFDGRETDRTRERQDNVDAELRGEHPRDATPERFDQRWLKRVQELTRALLDAEEAMAAARAKAREADVEIAYYDQASGFVDDVEDGYRVSFEREIAASAPVPKITSWLSEVPSTVTSPTFAGGEASGREKVDSWDAQDVDVSDSASCVAEGAERKRIDKWRKVCGLE